MTTTKKRKLKKQIETTGRIYCIGSGIAVGTWLFWAVPQAVQSLWFHVVSWAHSLTSLIPSF